MDGGDLGHADVREHATCGWEGAFDMLWGEHVTCGWEGTCDMCRGEHVTSGWDDMWMGGNM